MLAAVRHATMQGKDISRRTPMSNQQPHNEAGKFYSYEKRQGILPISWEDYFGLCKGLALAISPFDPEIILGVARGRLYAGTLHSHMLETAPFTILITPRVYG